MATVAEILSEFERDVARNRLFLTIEARIKNPASVRSRHRSETLLSAYTSLTCGRFESYLQEAFRSAADDLRIRIVSSSDARITKHDTFHWTNLSSFIKWAATAKGVSKADLEPKIVAYAQAIASGHIYSESFQYTHANPKWQTLKEMFSRFGIEDCGRKLANKYVDSRGRIFSKDLLEARLDGFVTRRHQAAHHGRIPGMTRADAADDDVFVLGLSRAVAAVLTDHLVAIV